MSLIRDDHLPLESRMNPMSTSSSTKKMSIFILQPHSQHASWQVDKLNGVYQLLESSHFKPNMIDEETMIKMTDLKGKLFVIEPFSGNLFQHLKTTKAWVLSPQLITACVDHNITIPYTSYPLYSLAMQGLTICCTNLPHTDRESIRRAVAYMGGRFQTNLNANVTHLICGACASSEKYFVAVENGIQVMMPDWVRNVLILSGQKTVKATDPTFERFKCPLFYKFTISLSGFNERDRNTIKQYVEREGATYSPNLIKDQCTHLICKEPKGSKYEHAIKWGIPALKPEWIFESSEKGSCLRLTNYLWPIANLECTNTKENDKPLVKDMVDSSTDQRRKSTTHLTNEEMNDLDERFNQWLNDRSKQLADDLFDGLKVYLGQFSSNLRMRIQKILDRGSAVRFDTLNPSVTHIIRGTEPLSTYASLSTLAPNAQIVNPQWILDCCEKDELVPETTYEMASGQDPQMIISCRQTDSDTMDEKKKKKTSHGIPPSFSRQTTGSFNVDQTLMQDETPNARRTSVFSQSSTPSIIPEYALSPFSLLKRYSNAPRPSTMDTSLTDTQIEKISADLPPTESQMNVDRLMSDIDVLMPTLLNQRSSSSSSSNSSGHFIGSSSSASMRNNLMPSRSFFLAKQQSSNRTIDETVSTEVKVSWIDDSTEAERLRQHQLHNLNEMTQMDEDYYH